jgi:hypothetical protein
MMNQVIRASDGHSLSQLIPLINTLLLWELDVINKTQQRLARSKACVETLLKLELKHVNTILSTQIFPLHCLLRKQWFISHSVTPCRFLGKFELRKRDDITCSGLAKLFWWRLWNVVLVKHSRKILEIFPFNPSNRLF